MSTHLDSSTTPATILRPEPGIRVEPAPASRRGDGRLPLLAVILGPTGLALSVLPLAWLVSPLLATAALVCGIIALCSAATSTMATVRAWIGIVAGALALLVASVTITSFVFNSVIERSEYLSVAAAIGEGSAAPSTDPVAPQASGSEALSMPGADESFGEIMTSTVYGSGDDTVEVFPIDGPDTYGYAVIEAEGGLHVDGLDASGTKVETLVDSTTPFTGSVLWNTDPQNDVVTFDVKSSGSWSVTLRSLGDVPKLTDGTHVDGSRDAVFAYSGAELPVSLAGEGDSRVWMRTNAQPVSDFCPQRDVITECSGTMAGSEDTRMLIVRSSGEWALTAG